MASSSRISLAAGEMILATSNISLVAKWLIFLSSLALGWLGIVILEISDFAPTYHSLHPFDTPTPDIFKFLRNPTHENTLVIGWIVVALSAILFVLPIIEFLTNQFTLTNRRIIANVGLISFNTTEMKLDKIESVNVRQSAIGRILGYGKITCTGVGGSRHSFPNIAAPDRFKLQLDATREEFKHLPR